MLSALLGVSRPPAKARATAAWASTRFEDFNVGSYGVLVQGAVLAWRAKALQTKTQGNGIALQSQFHGLSGQGLGLNVKQVLDCERRLVAAPLWAASRISAPARLEPGALFFSSFGRGAHAATSITWRWYFCSSQYVT